MSATDTYYDALAPYYRLIYADWAASVAAQAAALHELIRTLIERPAHDLLDAACGLGTQSLGLAAFGYRVTGSDLSPALVAQARAEAQRRDLAIDFVVGDMRRLWDVHQRDFDVVLAADNALPHLLSEADICTAFEQMRRCTRSGGVCLISVRDYTTLEKGGRRFYGRKIHDTPQGRVVLFDVWDFDGDYYDMTTYVVEDSGTGDARTHVVRGGRYYCVTLDTLARLMHEAGFVEVRVIREGYFQPVIAGLRPATGGMAQDAAA